MVVLLAILYVAAQRELGAEVPALAVAALSACLYALVRERALRIEQHQTTVRLIARERLMTRMNRRIAEEREKSEHLGGRLGTVTSLYRAMATTHAVQDPGETLPTMVEAACELVGADCGSLQLLDDTKSVLVIAACDRNRKELCGAVQGRDEGVAGWVLRNGEVLVLEGGAANDPRFDSSFDQGAEGAQCAMVVPLSWHGEPFGVLNLSLLGSNEKRNFTVEDQSLVRVFGRHAALVVIGTREWERRRR